ncbi:MAG: thiamine pyrophosphate-binding protein [Bacteroidales bacterium]|nr:thiamine pyrophosphate-binding protein [Bacteroidales bacterium]
MTVADHIADQLFKAGVRRVFGIPGGSSIPYLEAFRKRGIDFILVSHEAAAGIMADVSARLSGVPGVCHATFGPGATNISTGVGGAFLDRSPVIVLTSELSDSLINRTTQMNISHQQLFSPVTRLTLRLSAEHAAEMMKKALTTCLEEYPGPVHIGLPADIAYNEVQDPDFKHKEGSRSKINNDISSIAALLATSKKPVLAAGLTAKRLGTGEKLLTFLEKYNIPVVLTPMAKGLIPEDHPSYAGVLFHVLSNHLANIYDDCDLVIGLGYDQVEYNYESWMPDVALIHFDTIKADLPEGGIVKSFTGDKDEWFSVLENLDHQKLVPREKKIKSIRREILTALGGFSSKFGPVAALRVLREELPAGSILTADVGSHLHLIGQFWDCSGGKELIMTNGWSGMGFGLPAALAASICKPEKKVVCITGDGGFLMMAGEIITARRYNLPVIVVVFSDNELNLIRLKQNWRNIPSAATELYRGDLFLSDSFLGVKVLRAVSTISMEEAVKKALQLDEPVIINAVIDPDDYKYLVVKQ